MTNSNRPAGTGRSSGLGMPISRGKFIKALGAGAVGIGLSRAAKAQVPPVAATSIDSDDFLPAFNQKLKEAGCPLQIAAIDFLRTGANYYTQRNLHRVWGAFCPNDPKRNHGLQIQHQAINRFYGGGWGQGIVETDVNQAGVLPVPGGPVPDPAWNYFDSSGIFVYTYDPYYNPFENGAWYNPWDESTWTWTRQDVEGAWVNEFNKWIGTGAMQNVDIAYKPYAGARTSLFPWVLSRMFLGKTSSDPIDLSDPIFPKDLFPMPYPSPAELPTDWLTDGPYAFSLSGVQADISFGGWIEQEVLDALQWWGVAGFAVSWWSGDDANQDNLPDHLFSEIYLVRKPSSPDPYIPFFAWGGSGAHSADWYFSLWVEVNGIFLHEIGHTLGLGHFFTPPPTTMNPWISFCAKQPLRCVGNPFDPNFILSNWIMQPAYPTPVDIAGLQLFWRSWPYR